MVNIGIFSGPWPLRAHDPWTAWWDRGAYFVVDAFFANKFFPLFSLLFGIGFGLQLQRFQEKGAPFARLWRRRMGALFVIGMVHAALLSTIDILVQYALLGAILYVVRRARDRTLLATVAVLLVVPILFMALALRLGETGWTGVSPEEGTRMVHAYAHAGLAGFERQRVRDLVGYYAWVGAYAGWTITAMFLLGYVVARRGIVRDLDAHRAWLVAVFRGAAIVGVSLGAARVALDHSLYPSPTERPWRWLIHAVLGAFGDPALCIAYASGLALFFTSPRGTAAAQGFARVGSNALSHYVLQSIVMSVLFFAGRLYGRVSLAVALLVGVGIYAMQYLASQRWHGRAPLERIWRRWSYG